MIKSKSNHNNIHVPDIFQEICSANIFEANDCDKTKILEKLSSYIY